MDQVRAVLQEGEGEAEGAGEEQPDEGMRSQVRPLRKHSQVGKSPPSIIPSFLLICAYYACFAPSCTAKQPFFGEGKSVMLHLLEGPA